MLFFSRYVGKVVRIDTKKVAPSQSGLEEGNIARVVRSYSKNPKEIILPVVHHPLQKGRLVLLDGHNTTCFADVVNDFFPNKIVLFGWIPDHNRDFIAGAPGCFYLDDISIKNNNILYGYNVTERISFPEVPDNIAGIRKKHSYLSDYDSLMRYSWR